MKHKLLPSLCQLSRIRRYITDGACQLAVLSLVTSRLDYCNSLLAGIQGSQLDRLQRIQNRAARLITRPRVPRGQIIHITPFLQHLHWLPVRQRVFYKLCTLVYRCLNGSGPQYLTELLKHRVRDARLRQPSTWELVVSRPRRRVGTLGFGFAGPDAWNSLPLSIRCIDTLPQFKTALKTYLWHLAFNQH